MKRLAGRDNFREVEHEWQWEFVYYVLSNLGIPDEDLDACFPDSPDEMEAEHKIELRNVMYHFDVTIVDDKDGGLKIWVAEPMGDDKPPLYVLVGEWKKCKFVYREDPGEVDPNLRIYVEVHADVWTILDDEPEED